MSGISYLASPGLGFTGTVGLMVPFVCCYTVGTVLCAEVFIPLYSRLELDTAYQYGTRAC